MPLATPTMVVVNLITCKDNFTNTDAVMIQSIVSMIYSIVILHYSIVVLHCSNVGIFYSTIT